MMRSRQALGPIKKEGARADGASGTLLRAAILGDLPQRGLVEAHAGELAAGGVGQHRDEPAVALLKVGRAVDVDLVEGDAAPAQCLRHLLAEMAVPPPVQPERHPLSVRPETVTNAVISPRRTCSV